MKIFILVLANVNIVNTELFVRSFMFTLDQVISSHPTRSALECSMLCDRLSECNAVHLCTERRCTLARSVIDDANANDVVYVRESRVSKPMTSYANRQ